MIKLSVAYINKITETLYKELLGHLFIMFVYKWTTENAEFQSRDHSQWHRWNNS